MKKIVLVISIILFIGCSSLRGKTGSLEITEDDSVIATYDDVSVVFNKDTGKFIATVTDPNHTD